MQIAKGEIPERRTTPQMIEVLMLAYYNPGIPRDDDRPKLTTKMIEDDLIARRGLMAFVTYDEADPYPEYPIDFELTERGKAFVKMLLDTPLPVQKWMDPREMTDLDED